MPTPKIAEPWRRRLYVPAYRVGEAARYARTSAQTVTNWHKLRGNKPGTLSRREPRSELTYLQLIEVGVVAAMRKAGLKLPTIRAAREYIAHELGVEFPFATYRFQTDGKHLFIAHEQLTGMRDADKLLTVNQRGQLAWHEILRQRLREFEYDEDIVLRWRVAGINSPVVIDPRVSFGVPNVGGIPTWVIKERWASGESIEDTASDLDIDNRLVEAALKYEGITPSYDRESLWVH